LLGCGLPKVSLGELQKKFKTKNNASSLVLYELYKLDQDSNSWFKQAKNFRNHITHVSYIRLSFHMEGWVAFKDPQSMTELADDVETTLSSWLSSMEQLIDRLRRKATSTGAP
jgi:hypothetical protein